MSNYNFPNEQSSVPSKDFNSILSHAFSMYKGVFGYAIIGFLVYSLLNSILYSIAGVNIDDINIDSGDYDVWNIHGFSLYSSSSGILSILISPIYIGFIFIINKFNTNHRFQFTDLFIGFRQNLGQILLFSLISSIILGISMALCFIPFLFVAPLFLLGYPILLFENATAIEAIKKSYKIAKENYSTFFLIGIVSTIISFSGFLLCCFGIIFTAFFLLAAMYSTYVAYCGRPKPLIEKES